MIFAFLLYFIGLTLIIVRLIIVRILVLERLSKILTNFLNLLKLIIEEDTVMETSEGCQCLDEPKRMVQLTLFDNNFYPHPVMFFEDSS